METERTDNILTETQPGLCQAYRKAVCYPKCLSDLSPWSPPAQVTAVSLESYLMALGSSLHVPPDVPAPCADCFSPMEIKLLTPVGKGLWSFLLGKKKSLRKS